MLIIIMQYKEVVLELCCPLWVQLGVTDIVWCYSSEEIVWRYTVYTRLCKILQWYKIKVCRKIIVIAIVHAWILTLTDFIFLKC